MEHNNYINYSKHHNNQSREIINENLTEESKDLVNEEVTNESVNNNTPNIVTGTVFGAYKLYVRKDSNKEAESICTIDENSVVQIDLNATDSDNEFYKITTSDGIEGYCMKKFISINQ